VAPLGGQASAGNIAAVPVFPARPTQTFRQNQQFEWEPRLQRPGIGAKHIIVPRIQASPKAIPGSLIPIKRL